MLDINDLTKRYGDLLAVDGASFRVPRGRIVGFVGPNGAGKSTTMRSIFGLVAPDRGTIAWDGAPVDGAALARFGYMPELRGLYPKMQVLDQVSFFAELKGVQGGAARTRARELLTSLGLGDRVDDPLEKLSHGNQQRVQLAVSLVNDPDLLVLDEPFNGLDPVAVDALERTLHDRVAAGAGVLFSSHQLDLVERICDEVVIIVGGVVRATGPVADVRRSAGHRVVRIDVDRPLVPLSDVVGGRHVHASTRSVTIAVDGDSELDALLAQARSAGELSRFEFDLPTLQQTFATIASADPNAGRTVDAMDAVDAAVEAVR